MKNLIFSLSIISIFALGACNKQKTTSSNSNSKNAFSVIARTLILNEEPSDFTLLISSVLPISSNNTYNISNTNTAIQASCKEMINCGSLTLNSSAIPFTNSNTYFLQSDSHVSYADFIGKNADAVFTRSNSSIPSFNLSEYSPKIIQVNYDGLVNSKINKNSSLRINWTSDNLMPSGKCVLVIEGSNENDDNHLFVQTIPDVNGTYTIESSTWSEFSNYSSVRLYLARGYNKTTIIEGKSIEMQFLNYCWTRLYFNS